VQAWHRDSYIGDLSQRFASLSVLAIDLVLELSSRLAWPTHPCVMGAIRAENVDKHGICRHVGARAGCVLSHFLSKALLPGLLRLLFACGTSGTASGTAGVFQAGAITFPRLRSRAGNGQRTPF